MKRRNVIKGLSLLPFAGGAIGSIIPSSFAVAAAAPERDVFTELGLRTFINAAGTYTAMTASLMPEEVMKAINNSAKKFAMLGEEQRLLRCAMLKRLWFQRAAGLPWYWEWRVCLQAPIQKKLHSCHFCKIHL
jgi:hypothetical protein